MRRYWLLAIAALAISPGASATTLTGGATIGGAISFTSPARASVAARSGNPIPNGSGTTPEAGGRVYAIDMYVPGDVSTLNVRLANRTWTVGVGSSITGNVAVYASDGSGKPTGSAFATFTGVTIPGDGTVTSVGPFNSITRGVDGKVVVLVGMPQGATPSLCGNVQLGYYVTGTSTVSPAPGAWTGVNPSSVLWVDLDYSTQWRRIVVLGDSITVGYSATGTATWEFSAFQMIAADKNINVDAKGVPLNGSLASFAAFGTNTFLWDEEKWSGNPDVLIDLGTNDIPGQNATTMKTNLQTIITHVQGLTTGRIWAATIPPQTAYADAGNVRVTYNTDLKANYVSYGLTGVRDRAASQATGGLADNSTQTTLYSAFDAGDGTHLSTSGQAQERTGWETLICGTTTALCN